MSGFFATMGALVAPGTVIEVEEMKVARQSWTLKGETVAFVPTMGALHAGHLDLVSQAKKVADRVVVSIFVNPLQFGPKEDFSKYPRTLKADMEKLSPLDVDLLFLPNAVTMYPDGFQTQIRNLKMAEGLCGAHRPGHFDGVLTVVLKLFQIVRPDVAIFGKKDYQQWRLIETMVRDLNLDIKIVGANTLRESDGLAMSSRNRFLSAERRAEAAGIAAALTEVQTVFKQGKRNEEDLVNVFKSSLQKTSPSAAIEYVEIRSQRNLSNFNNNVSEPAVILTAVKLDGVRLIDNMELDL